MSYLIFAILFTMGIMLVLKLLPIYKIDNLQAITFNYIVAALLSFSFFSEPITVKSISSAPWLPYAFIIGILFIWGFWIFALSTQRTGISVTTVAAKISLIIPITVGVLLYNDTITLYNGAGIIVALCSFYFILKKDSKSKVPRSFYLLPLLVFITCGINDSLLNYNEKHFIGNNNELFIFLSILFSISFIAGIIINLIKATRATITIRIRNILAGTILGIANFGSTYFFIKAMGAFPSTFFFPVFNIGLLVLSVIIGVSFFKERLSIFNWIGIGLAAIAVLLIYSF